MATAAVSAEYMADAIDFDSELRENGYRCSFGSMARGLEDWDASGDYEQVGYAHVFPIAWSIDKDSDIAVGDSLFLVSAFIEVEGVQIPLGEWRVGIDAYGGAGFYTEGAEVPRYTHMIDSDGRVLELINAKKFKPDGINTIYFEVQAR